MSRTRLLPNAVRGPVVIAVLCFAGTIVSLQQTLVIPMLTNFPVLLNTTVDNASWLVTAALLAGAVATPIASRLADMVGKRRLMLIVMAMVGAGSVLGALSSSLGPLIVARALQGTGTALVPIGIAIMFDELPTHRVPLGIGLMSATLAIGAGIGMPLSGYVVENFTWQTAFWMTAILALLMLAALIIFVPESPQRTPAPFDVLGAVVLSTGLLLLLLVITKGATWGLSPVTLGCGIGAIALLSLFVPLQLRTPGSLVDVRTASIPLVAAVNIAAVLTGFAMFANIMVTTIELQNPPETGYGFGFDPQQTGIWLAPGAVAFGAMAPISARSVRHFGGVTTLLIGALLMSGAYAIRALADISLLVVVIGATVVAAATSLAYTSMPALIMGVVPVTETAAANGLNTLMRTIGTASASAGVGLITAASAVSYRGHEFASETSIRLILWLGCLSAAAAVAVVVPLLRHRHKTTPLPKLAGEAT